MDVFLTKYGHENCHFLVTNRKKRAVFMKKSRLESSVLFGEWSFFTKYGHESDDFSVRNRKKGHHIDFFAS